MNWQYLKDKVYYWDGAWLDIYVLNIEEQLWLDWITFVNSNFKISWYGATSEKEETQIDPRRIQAYWNDKNEFNTTATIFLTDQIEIKSHFFVPSEFENDVDPRTLKNMEDHAQLMNYLTCVSIIMDGDVLLSPENCPHKPLIKVNREKIEIIVDT